MPAHDKKPSDFDWVTARSKCSTASMFERLREMAQDNIARRNAITAKPDSPKNRFELVSGSFNTRFGVRDGWGHIRRATTFVMVDNTIQVHPEGHTATPFTATLTLNDEGQCKFLVEQKELDAWQVLKRALEPLLFPAESEAL